MKLAASVDIGAFARPAKRDSSQGWHSYKLPKDSLSPRELEVCQLLLEGLLVKEVAGRLDITYRTAETHRRSAYQKLGIHGRAELFKCFSDDTVRTVQHSPEFAVDEILGRLEYLEEMVRNLAERFPEAARGATSAAA